MAFIVVNFFNISHTQNAVACAFSSNAVGIDIEKMKPINLNIAKKICCSCELQQLNLATDKNHLLLKIWTAKESFAKMNAESVFSNLTQIDHKQIENLHSTTLNNFILSICSKNKANILIKTITLVDFKNLIA